MASFPDANDGSVPTRITVKCCHGDCREPVAYGFPLCLSHLRYHHAPIINFLGNSNKKQNDDANKEGTSAASNTSSAAIFESLKSAPAESPVTSGSRTESNRKRLYGKVTARKTSNLPRASPMAPITRRPNQPSSSFTLNGKTVSGEPSRKKRRVDISNAVGDESPASAPGVTPPSQSLRDLRSNRETSSKGSRSLRETPASSFYGHSPSISEVARSRAPLMENGDLLPAANDSAGPEVPKAKTPAPVVEPSPKVFNQGLTKYWEEHRAMLTSSPTGPQLAHERQLHEEQAMKAPALLTAIRSPHDISVGTITPGGQRPNIHSTSSHQSQISGSTHSTASGGGSETLAPQMQKHLLRLYSEKQSQVTGQKLNLDMEEDLGLSDEGRILFPGAIMATSQSTRSQAKHTHDVEQPAVARRLLRCMKRDIQASTNETSNAQPELLPVDERRRWLLSVDAQPTFDRLIYSQGAAQLTPPRNVHLPPRMEPPEPHAAQLFAAFDPHTHWCRPRSEAWLEEKASEIELREDRKERFGMAVESLAIRRREEACGDPAPVLTRDPLPVHTNGRSRGKSNTKRPSRGGESGHANGLGKNIAALARMRAQFDSWDAHVWEKDKEQTRKDQEATQAVLPMVVPKKRGRRKANSK